MKKLTEALKMLEENPDIVAWKIWTKDDIKKCLEEDGFLPSDENVDFVMQAVCEELSDCSDDDWDVIRDAIYGRSKELELKPDKTSVGYLSNDEIIF